MIPLFSCPAEVITRKYGKGWHWRIHFDPNGEGHETGIMEMTLDGVFPFKTEDEATENFKLFAELNNIKNWKWAL